MPAGRGGDRVGEVVVVRFRPFGVGRYQVQDVAVADLGAEGTGGFQRGAVDAPQHPSAVRLARVGERLAAVAQDAGQQVGHGYPGGQRHLGPPVRRGDGDPRQVHAG